VISVVPLRRLLALAPLAAATLLAAEKPALAILTITVYETGSNLVVQASGSLNLPSSFSNASCALGQPGGVIASLVIAPAPAPPLQFICTGPESSTLAAYAITGPLTFFATTAATTSPGTGYGPAISVSGLSVYFNPTYSAISLESSYVSGSTIASSATFNGVTLADLGFTAPSALGTWTLAGTGDTINLVASGPPVVNSPPSAVPGPLPLFGAAAAFCYSRRLRRRVTQSHSAANPAGPIRA
jgi:hypothetical protein